MTQTAARGSTISRYGRWATRRRCARLAHVDGVGRGAASLTGRAAEGHRSQALWAADCAERVLPLFEEQYPDDDRPRRAIEAARAWARGEIRVGEARTAALAAHAAARDAAAAGQLAASAAARAAGHAAATAHVASHARAVTFYAEKVEGYAKTGLVTRERRPRP
jgi:hypothetical protein